MPIHRAADRLTHYKTDSRTVGMPGIAPGVDDEVGLCGAHAVTDRDAEFSRPGHPVSGGKHAGVRRLGGQRAPAFTAPAGDNPSAGASAHPQPEPMDLRPPSIVRLESPLSLGHGFLLVNIGEPSSPGDTGVVFPETAVCRR